MSSFCGLFKTTSLTEKGFFLLAGSLRQAKTLKLGPHMTASFLQISGPHYPKLVILVSPNLFHMSVYFLRGFIFRAGFLDFWPCKVLVPGKHGSLRLKALGLRVLSPQLCMTTHWVTCPSHILFALLPQILEWWPSGAPHAFLIWSSFTCSVSFMGNKPTKVYFQALYILKFFGSFATFCQQSW